MSETIDTATKKYRKKKPIVVGIQAVQFKGGQASALKVQRFCDSVPTTYDPTGRVLIHTTITQYVYVCDWVIKDERGRLYISSSGDFSRTYEAVEKEADDSSHLSGAERAASAASGPDHCALEGPGGRGECWEAEPMNDRSRAYPMDPYGKPLGWCCPCWRRLELERMTLDRDRLSTQLTESKMRNAFLERTVKRATEELEKVHQCNSELRQRLRTITLTADGGA